MFPSRFGVIAAATALFSFTSLSSASAQSVEQIVSSELGHSFGLWGPLAFDADGVFVRSNTVSLQGARYGSIPVDLVSMQMRPLGDSVYEISSIEMPTDVLNPDGSGVQASEWRFQGEWNDAIKGYQTLDYKIADLRMTTPNGGRYTADEVVMRADENGYSLRLSNLAGSGGKRPTLESDPDTSFALSIDTIIYEGRWTGSAAGAPYASLGRSFDLRFLQARSEGGDSLLASTLEHLENLYLPASSSFTDLQISGLEAYFGPQKLKIKLDSLSLPASSEGEQLKTQMVNVVFEGLDINRREDFASMKRGSVNVDLDGANVEAFSMALASLFKSAEAGANWSVLADILLFFDRIGVEGSAEGLVFALPDRLFSISMQNAQGALGLTDMRLDGGFITLRGQADGIDLQAIETPLGVEPDPIVIPGIVPVLGGRLIRFDPLSQSLVPNELEGTVEVTGLPMANLRQTLASLPRSGSVQEPSVLMRSMIGGALGMVTPFLIQPPQVNVTDTQVIADDYSMSLTGQHQVMPIPPLFGFGRFTASVEGLSKVEARANATTEAALAAAGEDAQGLADYGRRIAGWAKRLRDLGTASSADEHTYVLELTQFGEIELNGAPLNQQ